MCIGELMTECIPHAVAGGTIETTGLVRHTTEQQTATWAED
jgi:hypothetical protein